MKPLNSAERSSSIVTFIAVYILIMAVPLYLTYMLGKNSKGAGGANDPAGQKELTRTLIEMQTYISTMEERDQNQVAGVGTESLWQKWVVGAESENSKFKSAIDQLEQAKLSGFKKDIRNSVVIYLRRLYLERGIRINLEKSQRGIHSETSEIQRLKAENDQLKAANAGLQNTINLKDQLMANASKSSAGGGSGGGGDQQNSKMMAELMKWELLFCDASSQKAQADILSPCNQLAKRKTLYEAAKTNFQKITVASLPGYTLKKMARDKVHEIDQVMARL